MIIDCRSNGSITRMRALNPKKYFISNRFDFCHPIPIHRVAQQNFQVFNTKATKGDEIKNWRSSKGKDIFKKVGL